MGSLDYRSYGFSDKAPGSEIFTIRQNRRSFGNNFASTVSAHGLTILYRNLYPICKRQDIIEFHKSKNVQPSS